MELNFFLKGLLLGVIIAAPVGPIAVLCIRKTVAYGRLSGFCSGLGAAVADTFYGAIAAFGLTLISDFLLERQIWLKLLGGTFLLFLGAKTFLTPPSTHTARLSHKTLVADFISTFFLTMTNPLTILGYLAIFAAMGLSNIHGDYFGALLLVSGIFLGSSFWWLILSEGVTLFRKRITQNVMQWINRIAGLVLLSFGVLAFILVFI